MQEDYWKEIPARLSDREVRDMVPVLRIKNLWLWYLVGTALWGGIGYVVYKAISLVWGV